MAPKVLQTSMLDKVVHGRQSFFEAPGPEHVHCGRGRGSVAWFPVHCTSINNTNDLISGDNKGVAAQLFKRWAGSQVLHSCLFTLSNPHPGDTLDKLLTAISARWLRLVASGS